MKNVSVWELAFELSRSGVKPEEIAQRLGDLFAYTGGEFGKKCSRVIRKFALKHRYHTQRPHLGLGLRTPAEVAKSHLP